MLLRGEPWIGGDPGVFLSVAGRLLEGDRLYADVFDNKDPLFYFTYAGALWLGGWRGPFMLDAVWLAVSSVSMALLIRELRAPQSAVIAGFFLYPLALTAGWYLVGMSMLGALAVAPLAPWLWLRRRFAAAGAVLVVVMLLKMNAAPLAAAPLVALLVLGAPEGRRRRALLGGALGVGGAGLAAVAFLAVRGELRPYLDTIVYNVHYASARTPSDTAVGRVMDHLRVAWDFFYLAGRWQVPTAILVLTVFGVVLCAAAIRRARSEYILGGAAIATLAGAFLVVALTASDTSTSTCSHTQRRSSRPRGSGVSTWRSAVEQEPSREAHSCFSRSGRRSRHPPALGSPADGQPMCDRLREQRLRSSAPASASVPILAPSRTWSSARTAKTATPRSWRTSST